ncbi:uncharacterized protein VTP21DRAFT_2435 [Calcarisporiella thermophila]|uniref:uncharacterized protein n=1 Tax=Calcarisporiella thermophila TaxID=911321 RepID=UPI00374318B1
MVSCLAKPRVPSTRIGSTIDENNILLTNLLGVGAYGVVYRARHLGTGRWYAIKCLPKVGVDSRQRAFHIREITLHTQVSSHQNIVTLEKVVETSEDLYVVLEYCDEGDLFYNIAERGLFIGDDQAIRVAFLQILDAVAYCHSLSVYHRDLKPENIMVFNNGRTLKLADFGLATTDKFSGDFGCGSTFYLSPECHTSGSGRVGAYCTAKNDVWSLGVILVNLTTGRNPWLQACLQDETFATYMRCPDILRGMLPITQELASILQKIFTVPEERISLEELRGLVMACERFYDAGTIRIPRKLPVEAPLYITVPTRQTAPQLPPPPSALLPHPSTQQQQPQHQHQQLQHQWQQEHLRLQLQPQPPQQQREHQQPSLLPSTRSSLPGGHPTSLSHKLHHFHLPLRFAVGEPRVSAR